MCGYTFIQIICDASVEASVIALDDIDMPCHEKWSSPLCHWSTKVTILYYPNIVFATLFCQRPIVGGLRFVTFDCGVVIVGAGVAGFM